MSTWTGNRARCHARNEFEAGRVGDRDAAILEREQATDFLDVDAPVLESLGRLSDLHSLRVVSSGSAPGCATCHAAALSTLSVPPESPFHPRERRSNGLVQ